MTELSTPTPGEEPVTAIGPTMVGDDRRADLVETPLPPHLILDGDPVVRNLSLTYSAVTGLSSGLWESTSGRFRVDFGCDEIVHVLDGEVRVEHEDGSIATLRAGDVAHFPVGTRTVWTVPEHVRKFWVCGDAPPTLAGRVKAKLRVLAGR